MAASAQAPSPCGCRGSRAGPAPCGWLRAFVLLTRLGSPRARPQLQAGRLRAASPGSSPAICGSVRHSRQHLAHTAAGGEIPGQREGIRQGSCIAGSGSECADLANLCDSKAMRRRQPGTIQRSHCLCGEVRWSWAPVLCSHVFHNSDTGEAAQVYPCPCTPCLAELFPQCPELPAL